MKTIFQKIITAIHIDFIIVFLGFFTGAVLFFILSSYHVFPKTDTVSTDIPEIVSTVTQFPAPPKTFFVKPDGNDNNDGINTSNPFQTIQKAVDVANPGDVIELLQGIYFQDVVTKRNGLPNLPITIIGLRTAVVKGGGKARIFEINHSYIVLQGFTIDGKYQDPNNKGSYRDKLVYVLGKVPNTAITNIRILNMDIKNAGGECVRFRYLAQLNEVANSTITHCGVSDFQFDGGGKNGEGVYIGTAPEQTDDGKNPTKDVDQSNNNWVHNNTIDTRGNECVDIKEGSSLNVVEYNSCTGQQDSESGGLDSRGNNNIFRNNNIYNNIGAGVRLGGDEKNDGVNNQVFANTIVNNKSGGIKIQRTPQGKICGNQMSGNEKGNSVGSYGSSINPLIPC